MRATGAAGRAVLAAPLLAADATASPAGREPDSSLARCHALYWLTANLAEEAPVGLVLDDAHWADASSLRFLQFALPRLEGLPVAVVLATRAAEPGVDHHALDALAADPLALVLRPAGGARAADRSSHGRARRAAAPGAGGRGRHGARARRRGARRRRPAAQGERASRAVGGARRRARRGAVRGRHPE